MFKFGHVFDVYYHQFRSKNFINNIFFKAAVEETAVVLLNDNIRSNLSAKFLELTCLINLLVHTWNTRINAVVEQVIYPVKISSTSGGRVLIAVF